MITFDADNLGHSLLDKTFGRPDVVIDLNMGGDLLRRWPVYLIRLQWGRVHGGFITVEVHVTEEAAGHFAAEGTLTDEINERAGPIVAGVMDALAYRN